MLKNQRPGEGATEVLLRPVEISDIDPGGLPPDRPQYLAHPDGPAPRGREGLEVPARVDIEVLHLDEIESRFGDEAEQPFDLFLPVRDPRKDEEVDGGEAAEPLGRPDRLR